MNSKISSRFLWGILVAIIFVKLIELGIRPISRHGIYALGIEPRYDGQTLGYWTGHAFHYSGFHRIANTDATDAIRSMGSDAFPFLVKWIATPMHSSQGIDYESRALQGFEIFGPAAKPAIPDLIKVIGRNNNWPSTALFYIGSDAVPALTEELRRNRTPDTYGDWRRNIPPNCVREYTILALSMIGTNAESALPVLMQCYQDEGTRSRADMAHALASVGHNQPQVVVPALIYMLTNSSGFGRINAAESLGSFGNEAQTAIPALLEASQSSDVNLQIQAAVAVKKISPQTPNALVPLINNLINIKSVVRRNAFFLLEGLGTNGVDALPASIEFTKHEHDPELRAMAIHCVTIMDTNVDEVLSVIRLNLTNENESVACAAVNGLSALAQDSQVLYVELRSVSKENPHGQVRNIAQSDSYYIREKHPDYGN